MKLSVAIVLLCAFGALALPHSHTQKEERLDAGCIVDAFKRLYDTLKNAASNLEECTSKITGAGEAIYNDAKLIDAKIDELNGLIDDWEDCSFLECAEIALKMVGVVGDMADALIRITQNVEIIGNELDPNVLDCIQRNLDIISDAFSQITNC